MHLHSTVMSWDKLSLEATLLEECSAMLLLSCPPLPCRGQQCSCQTYRS